VEGDFGNLGTGYGSIINQGTISCDVSGGLIQVQPPTTFVNHGMLAASNGGQLSVGALVGNLGQVSPIDGGGLTLNGTYTNNLTLDLASNAVLTLDGNWVNTGVIGATNATVNLGGSFSVAAVGVLNRSGGTVNLTGLLNNTNTTLTLNAASGSWVLNGGTVAGGTISESGGAELIVGSGTLEGVTVNGTVDVGSTIGTAVLNVLDGLTLNGTMLVGNPTNSNYGQVRFNSANQTLGGSGTVVFGSNPDYNGLGPYGGNLTLTIGQGITVEGDFGNLGTGYGSIINQGTISCDVSGGLIQVQPLTTFANLGTLAMPIGTINLDGSNLLSGGTLSFGINGPGNSGHLTVTGSIVLAGTLSATLNNGYIPALGAAFPLVTYSSFSGSFTATNLPPVVIWQTAYNPSNVTLTVLKLAPPPAPVLTLLHSFAGADGGDPYPELTASGNTLFGTTWEGGASGDGTVFTVNTVGGGFSVLHSFNGTDGGQITAGLLLASNTLYGAGAAGGQRDDGTLFSLATDGASFTNNHIFDGTPDGANPAGGLLLSGNILYGTTRFGGSALNYGMVFAVETNGSNFTALHVFSGSDGENPLGNLVLDGNVLYGTTSSGGGQNSGAIYSVQTDGSNFALLHSFSGTDGSYPTAGLVLSGGTLYGTAEGGGNPGDGTVFSMAINGSNFTVLHNFNSVAQDGTQPLAALFLSGNVLYGTTTGGGMFSVGTLFSIDTDGSNYTQLYSFGEGGANDGANPHAPVILVGGSLYGTTANGGSDGYGTVFGLQLSGVAFTLEPVGSTNAPIGTNAIFTAVGESLSFPTATIQYQWRLNGVVISGATTSELAFPDVQPTNGGTLTVTISDGINAATSVPVGLSVDIPTVASGNTNFANRFLLTQAVSSVVGANNTDGTQEAGAPQIITGNPGGKPIWFQWEPTNSGTAVFTTLGSDFDTILGVYTGTNVSALTRVPSCVNDDDSGGFLTSKVEFNCVAGTPYEIVVDGYWGASGNVVLSWSTESFAEPLPSLLVVPPRQTVASNGAAATLVCQPDSGVPSWVFNGLPTGVTGPDFPIVAVGDGSVGIYVAETTLGGAVASTQPAHLQFNVLEDGTSDPKSIAWNKFLDSANSPYSNPTQSIRKLGGGGDTRGYSVSQTFSTVGAVSEPGEPTIAGQIGGSPCWYTYVTPTNGALLINTAGSSFNTLLGVFVGSGSSFATITNIGSGFTTNRLLDGQPQVYIPNAPKGQTNFIVVDGYNGASGTVNLNINLGDPIVIATPPQSQSVPTGSNVTFTVTASGSIPLTYLWQFDGTNIAGATNSSLTVSNAQSANFGTYTVVISNLVSASGAFATLSPLNLLRFGASTFIGGEFQLQLAGVAGASYIIQTSTNLVTWTPLLTNIATNGLLQLTDTNASNFERHFYRGVAN
jgi:uncharacterized repeat protein (TIGR03803 family)